MAIQGHQQVRDRSAGRRTVMFDALEPRMLFSGSVHSFACGCGICGGTITPEEANANLADVSAAANAALDLSQTFALHSLPGAKHTIYLDFDGHTTAGTYWNTYENGGQAFTTPAYSTDGSAAFSAGELTTIQHIWQRVAEDFAPFQVNVTTQEPPIADLVKAGPADTSWGIRVVIGGSSQQWFGGRAGGVAWIGSFNWNSDTPVFVFEEQLGNGHEKYTAEAITHEVGHALGLNHDGVSGKEYYEGHGSGETGWAPIMGSGYYQNVTQWSKGEYAGSSQRQDDLSIITSRNGFGYRPDDTGDSFATATPLDVSGSVVTSAGLIETTADADVYTFTTGGGSVSFAIDVAARGPNLDVFAELLDAAGNVIVSANPAGLLGAHLSTVVGAGTYFLRVSGAAETNGWYTDYASLGQYTIRGEVQAAEQLPTLSINNTTHYESNGWARISLRLSEASDRPVTVVWGTSMGTARNARDFSARAGSLVFQPGQTQRFIYVRLVDDAMREHTERLWVRLLDATGAAIGRQAGTMYILDNEPGAAARRAAQAAAKAKASAAATAAPASFLATLAWQLQQSQRTEAAGFQWSTRDAGDELNDHADDLLAQLPAVA